MQAWKRQVACMIQALLVPARDVRCAHSRRVFGGVWSDVWRGYQKAHTPTQWPACLADTKPVGPLGRSMRKAWKNPTVGGPVFQQHHSLITDFLETSHPLYHMAQMTYQLSRLKSSNL